MKRCLIIYILLVLVAAGAGFCQTYSVFDDHKKPRSLKEYYGEDQYNKMLTADDPYANEGWSMLIYGMDPGLYEPIPPEIIRKRKIVPLLRVPDYLEGVFKYEGEGLYTSIVYSYNPILKNSNFVQVYQNTTIHTNGKLFYEYCGDSFVNEIDSDIDNVIKTLPVVQRAILHGRFECTLYDASRYGAKYHHCCLLTVVKDNGKIIWYDRGHELGDVAITEDGRYFVSTAGSDYYVTVTDERIIAEVYGGIRRFGHQVNAPIQRPVSCRILTDNIVRLEYKDGCVEYWRTHIGEDAVLKNKEKWDTYYEKYGIKDGRIGGSKHLIWCNGVGKGYAYKGSEESWEYSENGEEPVYEGMKDMSTMKYANASHSLPSAKSAGVPAGQTAKATANKDSDAAAPGLFARLFARIKGFFAGLFA